jgi:hypothetical protein
MVYDCESNVVFEVDFEGTDRACSPTLEPRWESFEFLLLSSTMIGRSTARGPAVVYSVFIYPTNDAFDVDPVKRHLDSKPDVFLDPLGTPTYVVCGVPEAVEVCRDARIEEPDRFPNAVLVTVQPDVINVFQGLPGVRRQIRSP